MLTFSAAGDGAQNDRYKTIYFYLFFFTYTIFIHLSFHYSLHQMAIISGISPNGERLSKEDVMWLIVSLNKELSNCEFITSPVP